MISKDWSVFIFDSKALSKENIGSIRSASAILSESERGGDWRMIFPLCPTGGQQVVTLLRLGQSCWSVPPDRLINYLTGGAPSGLALIQSLVTWRDLHVVFREDEWVPGNTGRWSNVGLMLGHRRKRWTNIKPALVGGFVVVGVEVKWLLFSTQRAILV